MLNLNKYIKYLIFEVIKVGLLVNIHLSNLNDQEKNDTTNLIWPKRPSTLEYRAGKIKS